MQTYLNILLTLTLTGVVLDVVLLVKITKTFSSKESKPHYGKIVDALLDMNYAKTK